MTKKKKLRDHKRGARMRLINAHNDTDRNRLFDIAEGQATLGKYQLAAGTWQHPHTGLWQVWMSSYGSDINWLSAHRDSDRAQMDVDEIKAAGQRGDFSDKEKVAALFKRLIAGSDGKPEDVDAADITTITASIVEMVFEARSETPTQPTVTYRYTLPDDDEEVIVSGIAMAILDSAKQVDLPDARAIQERALWHCEMSRKHIREGELTNDYEGFQQLFITNYTHIYERNPVELSGPVRDIINRYDLTTALVEIRNIVKSLYFPDLADLVERLTMEYRGVLLTPHRSLDGYYATFSWRGAIMRTPDLANPTLALAQAQRMIDKEQSEQ